MNQKKLRLYLALFVAGMLLLVTLLFLRYRLAPIVSLGRGLFMDMTHPTGTLVLETAPGFIIAPQVSGSTEQANDTNVASKKTHDWPSFNRSLTGERFTPLTEINNDSVQSLKVLCSYDTGQYSIFQTGLLMVDGMLIGTTERDIFSLDPGNCQENWRTHETFKTGLLQGVNRGAAYADGRLFRGSQDGQVLAYDSKTGQKLWSTLIADASKGESVSAAPIAWHGRVFIGNAGGDFKGVKGRMYALDAATGKIIWEFYLVPKDHQAINRSPSQDSQADAVASWGNANDVPISGGASWTSYSLDPDTGRLYIPAGNPAPDFVKGARAGDNLYSGSVVILDALTGQYLQHLQLVPHDWHDWDVSNAPAIFQTRGGRKILSVAPKNGYLYGFDLANLQPLYRSAITRIENAEAEFSTETGTHFCPGSMGGAEWNGPSYNPKTNLVMVGEIDWCTTVTMQNTAQIKDTQNGATWAGMASRNPFHTFGKQDPHQDWAGWLYATDADSGAWQWRLKSNYPILSGVTSTAGDLVLFGDMGGNFYAVDARTGQQRWGEKIGGAIGGGVITYEYHGQQKIAVATGMTSVLWPTESVTARVIILGLP
ncbi:pyrroloquinoline quinone-dependent dehydrogenase [Ampullimonas aquatilis]|uniref:pyrroloquinoline quinone-dependent dehydrogenase n=1 Tax=Ampullimonas aquatilis TaxID=1341549 RepID=UPI003C73DD36